MVHHDDCQVDFVLDGMSPINMVEVKKNEWVYPTTKPTRNPKPGEGWMTADEVNLVIPWAVDSVNDLVPDHRFDNCLSCLSR
jgi:hypothetical protein